MKKNWKMAIGLFLVTSSSSVFGAGAADPAWMFADRTDLAYQYFRYCDTARAGNYNCFAIESDQIPDTGSSFDGSKYINWDYKISSDTFKIINEFDSNVVDYKDYRDAVAGFKTAWDYGMTGFPFPRYKYLVFAHKGPNPNHKVTVKAWYNNGECGAPSYNETIGTFTASTDWKVDSIAIPEEVKNKDDKARNTSVYYELVFIITNLDPNDKTPSGPSNLKVDNIRLVGCNPVDTSPKPQVVSANQPATFTVTAAPSNTGDVLTYQWMKNDVAIAGATSPTYTIAAATEADAGTYKVAVTVSNTGMTYYSQPATLTVNGGGCGCGTGTGLAFIPPLFYKVFSRRKNKNKK